MSLASSPFHGRFQTRKFHVSPVTNFVSASTGVFATFPVCEEKIEILGLGLSVNASTGAVSTPAVITAQKQVAGGSAAAIHAGAVVSPVANQTGPKAYYVDLDEAAVDPSSSDGTKLTADYPPAERGNLLSLNLTTQGAGGTQTGYAWIEYRERPSDL